MIGFHNRKKIKNLNFWGYAKPKNFRKTFLEKTFRKKCIKKLFWRMGGSENSHLIGRRRGPFQFYEFFE